MYNISIDIDIIWDRRESMHMDMSLMNHFVSVSDFSQGKANKIFNDVAKNLQGYVVLKNNKPAAVVLPVVEYENMNNRIKRLEAFAEKMNDYYMMKVAEDRKSDEMVDFEDVLQEEGFSMKELEILSESVDIE